MKLRGYKPPPLPKPPRKPSKWIRVVAFPLIREPDRSNSPDPRTYDAKGSNTRVAVWLFLGCRRNLQPYGHPATVSATVSGASASTPSGSCPRHAARGRLRNRGRIRLLPHARERGERSFRTGAHPGQAPGLGRTGLVPARRLVRGDRIGTAHRDAEASESSVDRGHDRRTGRSSRRGTGQREPLEGADRSSPRGRDRARFDEKGNGVQGGRHLYAGNPGLKGGGNEAGNCRFHGQRSRIGPWSVLGLPTHA